MIPARGVIATSISGYGGKVGLYLRLEHSHSSHKLCSGNSALCTNFRYRPSLGAWHGKPRVAERLVEQETWQ